jgi:hypothetical protein
MKSVLSSPANHSSSIVGNCSSVPHHPRPFSGQWSLAELHCCSARSLAKSVLAAVRGGGVFAPVCRLSSPRPLARPRAPARRAIGYLQA